MVLKAATLCKYPSLSLFMKSTHLGISLLVTHSALKNSAICYDESNSYFSFTHSLISDGRSSIHQISEVNSLQICTEDLFTLL